ncbi:MAG: hypothetical protein O0X93_01635 [Methanocorpusculum sp.]|nr:hypothetical protein [Methanocorpusculum sp.]
MSTTQCDVDLQTRLNIRVGKKFKEKYNKYLDEHEISGASFSRDALEYWMSVNGHPENMQQELMNAQKDIQHLQELLVEKERTISILQNQIQLLNVARGHVQVNGNKYSKITAVAERESKYHRGDE